MPEIIRRHPRTRRERPPQVGAFLPFRGRRVHALLSAEGEPVLLLHGNCGLGEEILAPFGRRKGVRWIAPDRPGYGFSEPLQGRQEDPVDQALWAVDLMDSLKSPATLVVAHSIASGVALCLAHLLPHRVLSMTLINPFCRPTPHRWMPGLRLAVAAFVGSLVRPAVPRLLGMARNQVLSRLLAPDPVPATLDWLPLKHATRSRALLSMAAELRGFNDGMKRADPRVGAEIPRRGLAGDA